MSTQIDKNNNKQRSPFHPHISMTREDKGGLFHSNSWDEVDTETDGQSVLFFYSNVQARELFLTVLAAFVSSLKRITANNNNSSSEGIVERGAGSIFLTQANSANRPAAVNVNTVSIWFQPGPLANKATYIWNAKMFFPPFLYSPLHKPP